MVTWIFTKCLLWTKQFLSRQHSHLASMLYCCCWFSWVLFCWPQTIYWSLLRKPLPDLKQRKNSCNPNDCSFLFLFLLLFFWRDQFWGNVFILFSEFVFFFFAMHQLSPTWWTWIGASSGSWWWTGKPGVLQSMGSQRVGHDCNWTELLLRGAFHDTEEFYNHKKLQKIAYLSSLLLLHLTQHTEIPRSHPRQK